MHMSKNLLLVHYNRVSHQLSKAITRSKLSVPYLLLCVYFYFFAQDNLDELIRKMREDALEVRLHGDGADGLNL